MWEFVGGFVVGAVATVIVIFLILRRASVQ